VSKILRRPIPALGHSVDTSLFQECNCANCLVFFLLLLIRLLISIGLFILLRRDTRLFCYCFINVCQKFLIDQNEPLPITSLYFFLLIRVHILSSFWDPASFEFKVTLKFSIQIKFKIPQLNNSLCFY